MDDWDEEIIQFDSLVDSVSSCRMDWGMKYSGLVPQTVAVNVGNASCEIILLVWNFGSGVYGLFSVSSSITAGCCGVPILPNLAGVFFGIGDVGTGSCISACVLNFLFLLVPFSPFSF